MSVPDPYPLSFEPLLYEKVWGGRRLASLGKALPEGANVGESWEIADLDATSASGAGGGAARSVIATGPLAGRTLRDAVTLWGDDLLGASRAGGGFPLLIKFLDAREHLSVQVHPSPAYAAAHPEAHLKTEAWHIVRAEPGSVLYLGLREGVGAEDVRKGVAEHSLVRLLREVPAREGDTHVLPSGLVHALGAGVLVAEVQTPSDTTFRLYDWAAEYGRSPRALHVHESVECIAGWSQACPTPGALEPGARRGVVGSTDYFTIEQVRGGCEREPLVAGETHAGCVIVMATRGSAGVRTTSGDVSLRAGRNTLVPSCLVANATLEQDDNASVLVVRPDAR